MLEDLGFDVRLYLARVIYNEDIHPGLTHRITLVKLGEKRYIADVGFGPLGPQFPVCMSGEKSHESFRIFRIRARDAGEFHMQTLRNGEFYTLYKFELARYGPADCEVGHFYSHKHPGATFVNHLVVSKIMDEEVRSLRNREHWIINATGECKHSVSNGSQLKMLLADHFDVFVSEAEGQRLFELTA
jgi:N-hydroxyarylamine O-acetyltransferase